MQSILLSMLGVAVLFGAVSCGTSSAHSRAGTRGETAGSSESRARDALSSEEAVAPQADRARQAEYALSEMILVLGALVDEPLVPIASLAQGSVSDLDAGTLNPLLDNTYYHKSRDLLQEARRLFDRGDYEGCLRLTQEAQEYARMSDEYVTRHTAINRADRAIEEAGSAIASVEAASRSTEAYKTAQAAYGEAKTARGAEDWNSAAEAAERALEALAAVGKPAGAGGKGAPARSNAANTPSEPRLVATPASAVSGPRAANPSNNAEPRAASATSASGPRAANPSNNNAAEPRTASVSVAPASAVSGPRAANPSNNNAAEPRTASAASASGPRAANPSNNAGAEPRTASVAPDRESVAQRRPAQGESGERRQGTPRSPEGYDRSAQAAPPASSGRGRDTAPTTRSAGVSAGQSGQSSAQNSVETPQVPQLSTPANERRGAPPPDRQRPVMRDTPSVPALAPPGAAIAGTRDTPLVAAITARPPSPQAADPWAPTAAAGTAGTTRPEGPAGAPHIASSLGEERSGGAGLSAQYRVQSWETSMDCLWNIAAKPWVYGDPNKWIILYRANSAKLPDPQNPHRIPPNIVLDIPSVDGEVRQGLGSWNAP